MTFAKWVFTIGGLWGVLIIGSLFFLEPMIVSQTGPLSHPDTYYGFAVSTFAMQIGYLVIGRNPAAYRPFMLIGAPDTRACASQPFDWSRQCSAPSNWLDCTSLSLLLLPSLPFRKAIEPPKLPMSLLISAPSEMPHPLTS